LRDGYDIGAATAVSDPANMTTFDRVALERDERFNTRISGYIGWEQAARKLIPTPRQAARFDLTGTVLESGARTTGEAVDYLTKRALRVPTSTAMRDALVAFLARELGTDISCAQELYGRPLRNDDAPGHEHARISAGLNVACLWNTLRCSRVARSAINRVPMSTTLSHGDTSRRQQLLQQLGGAGNHGVGPS
jgi:hypothetical protein